MSEEKSESKYGDFDPTKFKMDNETPVDDSKDKSVEVAPIDHEIERNPEKIDNTEARVSPEEYIKALEKILTTPERERALDKLNRILETLDSMEPAKKAEIMAVLGDTFSEIHKASGNLKEAYESIELILDDIINDLEKK